ncbi:DEAD/DEAH box helicase [Aeromonas veronii]
MDIFDSCHKINDLISSNQDDVARDELIKLLDHHERHGLPYSHVVNNLVRQVGLYPYLQVETSAWQDRFVYESFKIDVGTDVPLTLHREQSSVLKKLLEGRSLAVSAPTSFGKSFIIDAFISIRKPKNVVIIVSTIALTDETRRRLQEKFSNEYKIITTSDVSVAEKTYLYSRSNAHLTI